MSNTKKQLKKAVQALLKKDLVLCPTDTIWGIGCDATSKKAVKKVYKLKNRSESKSLIILVSSVEMLQEYVDKLPKQAIKIIETAQKPTTIIYNAPKNLAKNCIAEDDTVAIRLVTQGFVYELVKLFGKPIVSTSANVSGEPSARQFSEISDAILKGVDYVVNLQTENVNTQASRIVKFDKKGKLIEIRA